MFLELFICPSFNSMYYGTICEGGLTQLFPVNNSYSFYLFNTNRSNKVCDQKTQIKFNQSRSLQRFIRVAAVPSV